MHKCGNTDVSATGQCRSALRPLIPRELEIDSFEGRAYVGLGAVYMRGGGLRGCRRCHCQRVYTENFHETNVRTYVYLRGGRRKERKGGTGVLVFSLGRD
jgi:uncharacterized protein YqjF (DUF2071 family)